MSYNKKNEIYKNQLKVIGSVKFTAREIDIIACILHNRGEKKIATLLAISPRTVGTHIHNIMLKLDCSSREYIIDFIEKSGALLFVRQYYSILLIQYYLKSKLAKIAKTINRNEITCVVYYQQISKEEKDILDKLKTDLLLANITLKDTNNVDIKSDFYILSAEPESIPHQIHITTLILKKSDFVQSGNSNYLDFSKPEEYYALVFKLLKKVINHKSLEQIIQEFDKEYQATKNSFIGENAETKIPSITPFKTKLTNKVFAKLICFIGAILVISIVIAQKFSTQDKIINISSDLLIPQENILLKRSSILDQIDKKLAGRESIQTVVLVGAGGCGKTTIAHQYARGRKVSLRWEINAETKDSLISSFEQLAYSLSKTEEEKRELSTIPQIKDAFERERKLFVFLTKKIRNYPDWLLIYNNVETFKEIQKYFPHDPDVWGKGKVIITTRDNNISHNSYILPVKVIQIGELSKEEKLELFGKIIYDCKDCTRIDSQKSGDIHYTELLEKIPSFPLDIAITAYYLKEENISYNEYLKYITEPKEEFVSFQKTILSDIGEYSKTRYDIVTLSIKRIIETHPDFIDLLLFISFIDAQNIPKDLLCTYKDSIIVSKFIHELRKFSLITKKLSTDKEIATFSIHHNTQAITLVYLSELLNLKNSNKKNKKLEDISFALEVYLRNTPEEASIEASLAPHIEAFLNHNKLLDKISVANLNVKLGKYYFHIANYKKARQLLEQAFTCYKEHYGLNNHKTAYASVHLGNVYRNTGNYTKSIELLEQALAVYKDYYGANHIDTLLVSTYLASVYRNSGEYTKSQILLEAVLPAYEKYYGKDHIKTAWVSTYLGSIYNNIGNYTKSIELLEQALVVYKEHYGLNNAKTAWATARLGNVFRNIGDYNKARQLLEQAVTIYKKNYGENCIETAWSLLRLGIIYTDLEDNLKAQELIQRSLVIYKDYFADDHTTIAWGLMHLGNSYQGLGDYERAQIFLERALTIYEKNYSKSHIQTAVLLNDLSEVYLAKEDIEIAEAVINRALNIFQQAHHPESYISLEKLANLYIRKSTYEINRGNIQQSQFLKRQSIDYLKQALEITKAHFPEDSPHVARIQLKLKNLEL